MLWWGLVTCPPDRIPTRDAITFYSSIRNRAWHPQGVPLHFTHQFVMDRELGGWPLELPLLGIRALKLHLLFHGLQLGLHILLSRNLSQLVIKRIVRTWTQ